MQTGRMSYSVWLAGFLGILMLSGCPPPGGRECLLLKDTGRTGDGRRAAGKPIGQLPPLARVDFNRIAAALNLPVFWIQDGANAGRLDPDELAVLGVGARRSIYLRDDGTFTPQLEAMIRSMVEFRRREAVARELGQGRPTLVQTDLASATEADRAIVRHVTEAARIVEELYALQSGSLQLQSCLLPGDSPSRALFGRNQGPWCLGVSTESDPFCNACPDFPGRTSGLYPPERAGDPKLCETIAARPDAETLLAPFVVVRSKGTDLAAVPYHEEWTERVAQVARELRLAAEAIPAGSEQAFKAYLLAAARAFETDDWESADEAWTAMNASNSAWYLRIGADEVYFEPCARKAGYHVSFARINPDSLFWQEKLTPLRGKMEESLAALIGKPYEARTVSFHMPDFIDILLNAGDSRSPVGATIGQSLPNWGKVAQEGRGRTVVMSNLYTDPDSREIHKAQGESLLSPEAMQTYVVDRRLALLDIVLHEAAHNFGPYSDFQIAGKRPGEIFGGNLASVLEEIKAQAGALYFLDLLRANGAISVAEMNQVFTRSALWCFGHIARGMFDASGNPKTYSQVAAVQIGMLAQADAIAWEENLPAANGTDRGRFSIRHERLPAAAEKLMQRIGRILATGDVEGAKQFLATFVTGEGFKLVHAQEVADRILRFPKSSFVYSVGF